MTDDGGIGRPAKETNAGVVLPENGGAAYGVNERFFGMLGMSRRAGKTVIGTDAVLAGLRGKNKPALVLLSSSASENTRKMIVAKCGFYGVPCAVVDVGGEELARRMGKTGFTAVLAVLGPGLAKEIANACTCKGEESPTDGDGSIGNRG